MFLRLAPVCLGLFAILNSHPTHAATDWLQFRGPSSSAVSETAQIPDTLAIDWSVPLPGRGLSSPILVGDRLFVTCSSGAHQDQLELLCMEAETGKLLWRRVLRATGRTMTYPKTSVAAPSPCSDGKRVFAVWSCNDVAAFDMEGDLIWTRGLTADYPNVSNSLGMASSPLVIGNTLVVMVENDSESYSLGLDVRSGRNLWKLDRPKAANWTSPVLWQPTKDARPAALLQSSKGVTAVDASTGSVLWDFQGNASSMSSCVVSGTRIFAPSGGITALQPAPDGAPPVSLWNSRQLNPSTTSPLLVAGLLLTTNNAGVLTAGDSEDGTVRWKQRLTGPFSATPVGAGNRVLAVSEKGLVQVVEVGAAEAKPLGQLQLPLHEDSKELILSTPALRGKHAYLRTDSTLWRIGPGR
jgi:outer membrane protein assembly factor BamB